MSIIRRFIPLLSSLLFAGLFEWLVIDPRLIWAVAVITTIGGIIASALVSRSEVRGGRWHFSILGALYMIATVVFLMLLHQTALKHLQIISSAVVWWLWLEQLYRFHYLPHQYIPFSVGNVTSVVTILTSFYFISSAFALKLFLGYPTWVMTVLTGAAGMLFTAEIVWSEKLSPWRYWIMPATLGLITAQLYWVLSFLPSSYLVNGFLITVVLYITVNLGRFEMKHELQGPVIRRYLLISVLVLLWVIATARWV